MRERMGASKIRAHKSAFSSKLGRKGTLCCFPSEVKVE
jgi:hypothetical protein